MDRKPQAQQREGGLLYRLEVQGALPRARGRWLEAEAVTRKGPNTVLLLRVLDQSDLHGRLRRIHDLNLKLVSVERLTEDESPEEITDAGGPEDDDVRGRRK